MNNVSCASASLPSENALATALDGALHMAGLGFPVFPLKPGTKDGFLVPSWKASATSDPASVAAYAKRHPGCNWGARCSGHLVLDVDVADGKRGLDTLALIDIEHGLPATREHRSARGGKHLLFRLPDGVEVSNRDAPLGGGINVRGTGGFIVCPGSVFEGRPYTITRLADIAEAPASLVALLKAPAIVRGSELPAEHMDHPAAIAGAIEWLQHRPAATKGERGSKVYQAAARLRDWGLSEPVSLELIAEHFAVRMDPPADASFCRHEVGSAYRYAQNAVGAKAVAADFADVSQLAAELAPVAEASPAARGEQLRWPRTDEDGKPIAKELNNIRAFLHYVGAIVWRDEFTNRDRIDGFDTFSGFFSGDAERALRIKAFELGLRPPKDHFSDAVKEFARRAARHPVREYLDALKWDGVPRVEGLLARYLGAEDTPLHREFGRLWLTAAVRRVRQPGCKFDNMLVLEGAQGAGKSTALKILAGDWFEESMTLDAEPKVVIEQTSGKWIIEIAELSGMAAREVEHVKTLITRTEDTARLAYAPEPVTVPRQFILAGTTNDNRYLRDTTGNRRFWPVKVGTVKFSLLTADRDQLWAEAAAIEAKGGPLSLARDLWAVASVAQEEREAPNPILDVLRYAIGDRCGFVSSWEAWRLAGVGDEGRPAKQADARAVAGAMRKLGFEDAPRRKFNGKPATGFVKWDGEAKSAPIIEFTRCTISLGMDETATRLLM